MYLYQTKQLFLVFLPSISICIILFCFKQFLTLAQLITLQRKYALAIVNQHALRLKRLVCAFFLEGLSTSLPAFKSSYLYLIEFVHNKKSQKAKGTILVYLDTLLKQYYYLKPNLIQAYIDLRQQNQRINTEFCSLLPCSTSLLYEDRNFLLQNKTRATAFFIQQAPIELHLCLHIIIGY